VYYDRAESAMSRMQPSDLPSALFASGNAKWFHTTGITLGISTLARQTAMSAATMAKQAGWLVAFDVNFRAKLWSAQDAYTACMEILPLCDLLFLPIRDAESIFAVGVKNPEAALEGLKQYAPESTIVMTLGAEGSIACDASGKVYRQSAIPTTEVERLGSGDAFSAGFLNRYLVTGDISEGLRWATAMASLKYTIPGDLPLVQRHEVESLANARGLPSNISISR
jgi:2-dehydro-3-deoxygluconokinase